MMLDSGKIEIIKVNHADLEQLQSISRESFYETFAAHNTKENMDYYLQSVLSLDKLMIEINDTHSEFYFAVLNMENIGYLKLNFESAQTELKEENSIEIERIYVLKRYHGYKVGQLLYEKALQLAKLKNVDFIWLGVWEENKRAIQFYLKNGFVVFDTHKFFLGDDEQTDLMMKLNLSSNNPISKQ